MQQMTSDNIFRCFFCSRQKVNTEIFYIQKYTLLCVYIKLSGDQHQMICTCIINIVYLVLDYVKNLEES